jgi:putative flippase GtrA
MGSRLRRLGAEAARFSAVNVVATVVAVVLFNVLVHGIPGLSRPGPLNAWPVTSWFLANCVGMGVSFYGSRSYAFKHRAPTGPGGGALMYTVVNLASFAIPMACLWVTRNVFHWESVIADNVSANVVGAACGMVFRFWAFRRFVFKKHEPLLPLIGGEHRSAGHLSAGHLSVWGPELRPHESELLEHQPKQGKADPHDVVGIAGHTRHEGPAEPVQGERPGHG